MKSGPGEQLDLSSVADPSTKQNYKETVYCIKKLEEAKSSSHGGLDYFLKPETCQIRDRLCELCERLYFSKPSWYGKKAEDITWKKCYYEPIQAWRANKHNVAHETAVRLHQVLIGADGYYRAWALKLHNRFVPDDMQSCFIEQISLDAFTDQSNEDVVAVIRSIHRAFTWLARYRLDFCTDPVERAQVQSIAFYYYTLAIRFKPEFGLPYSQLGTMTTDQNHGLDSMCYYLKCVLSPEPFDGVGSNLKMACKMAAAIDLANDDDQQTAFVKGLMMLVCSMHTQTPGATVNLDRLSSTAASLADRLSVMFGSEQSVAELDMQLIEKAVCLILMAARDSVEKDTAAKAPMTSLVLCLLITLARFVSDLLTAHIVPLDQDGADEPGSASVTDDHGSEVSVPHKQKSGKKSEKKKKRDGPLLMRRRAGSDIESDEDEERQASQEETDSDEDVLTLSSADEADLGEETYHTEDKLDRDGQDAGKSRPATCRLVDFDPQCSELLVVFELLLDALPAYRQLLQTDEAILNEILTTLLKIYSGCASVESDLDSSPLAARWSLYQVLITTENAVPLKTVSLRTLGQSLAHLFHTIIEMYPNAVRYDGTSNTFGMGPASESTADRPKSGDNQPQPNPVRQDRHSMMHQMAQLRTTAELAQASAIQWVPVYLLPDVNVLIGSLNLLLQLADSSKFVIVIAPKSLAALDKQKKDSGAARDAIRWIEAQASRGSKFVRSAKPKEYKKVDTVDADIAEETLDVVCVCAGIVGNYGSVDEHNVVATILTQSEHTNQHKHINDWALNVPGVSVQPIGAFSARWRQQHRSRSRRGGGGMGRRR